MIVIDSSYALATVMPDEIQPASAAKVFKEALHAPFIWPLEIANALRNGVKRRRLAEADAMAFGQQFAEFEVNIVDAPHRNPARHLALAQLHDLTPYDALYLMLALQHGCAIATHDDALAQAARRAGLAVHQ